MKHLILVILICFSVSLAAASVRIALVPLDELSQNHADLALASLSTEDGFDFLEREKINLIRREVRLIALDDWAPDPHLMQNTELFVILKKKELLAFDAVTGVRLVDTQADTPEAISQAVRIAASKRQNLAAKRLRKLSFLPLIPVHLNDIQEQRARLLFAELLRQLGNRPDLVVLERHHLLLVLNEPGATTSDLTKNLFTGAIVVKPVATPETQDKIRLRLNFFTPDAQTSLGTADAVFFAMEARSEVCRKFLSHLKLPEGDYDERANEARNFIYEAWFAVSHQIRGESLPAAASAVALDDAHERELCRIAALNASSPSLWGQHSGRRSIRTSPAFTNLQLAERLAIKHNFFPNELVRTISDCVGTIPPKIFASLEESIQRDVRETIDRLIALRKRSLDKYLRSAELPADKLRDRIAALEARMKYIREMSKVCEIAWDYSWWEKYIFPELERYIKDSNEMMPELLSCRYRNMFNLNLGSFLEFRRFDTNSQTPENLERFRRIMQTLTESNLLDLAYYGHVGLLRLQLRNPDGNSKRAASERRAAVIAFMDTLVQLFATKEAPYVPYQMLSISWVDEHTISQVFQIQELAMKRFAWLQPWDTMIPYHPTWSRETAIEVHRRLSEFNQQIQQDPRLHKDDASTKEWMVDYFRKQQRRLEEQYDIPSDQPEQLPVVDPFERLVPLNLDFARGEDYAIQVIGFDGRFIYLDHQNAPRTLLSIDTANDLTVTQKTYASSTGWRGRRQQGVILKDFLASGNGPFVFLYPKDGSAMQTLDFRAYCKDLCHALVGCGDRLFLSYDGFGNKPGTVLEYNVKTGETKRLVSTLDTSVVWPLQGRREPYQISRLLCDEANRRLIMLMHDQLPVNKNTLSFKAYYWESGEWRNASNSLPIPYNSDPIFLDNGRLWLLEKCGFGPVNAEGNWQPVFLRNNSGHFSDKLLYEAEYLAAVKVDLSRLMQPPEKYRHLNRSDLNFTDFDHGILFAEKLLMLVPECHIIITPKRFQIRACFAGKFVVGHPIVQGRKGPLHIGILKDRAELLREAERQKNP